MTSSRTVSRARVAYVLLAVLPLAVRAGTNTWTGSGPQGGDVRHVEFKPDDGDVAYATAPAGLYQSTDGGAKWSLLNPGVGSTPFAIDPINPKILYLVDFDGGLLRSSDGGVTIGPVDNWVGGLSTSVDVGGPGTSVIFAGTVSEGVVRSNDGGATWRTAHGTDPDSLPQLEGEFAPVDGVVMDPTSASIVYATYSSFFQGIYRTKDGGVHWFPRVTGIPPSTGIAEIAIDPVNPENIYAATDAGVYYSTDQGGTWLAATTPIDFEGSAAAATVIVDPEHPTTLYAGTFGGGVFKSIDAGHNWMLSNTGVSPSAVRGLATHDGVTLLAATTEGVSRSTDSASSWADSNDGLVASKVIALASDPQLTGTLLASTTGIQKSTHAGSTWAKLTDIAASSLLIDPHSSGIMYAAASDGVEKSVNGGVNWSSVLSGVTTDILAYSVSDGSIYALGSKGPDLYRTTDAGTNWTTVGTSIVDGEALALIVDIADSQTLYLGTAKSGAFRSANGGVSWDALAGLSGAVTGLAQDPTDGAILFAATGGGLFRSSDGGATWGATGAPDVVGTVTVVPTAPEILYGTRANDTGILRSLDAGASWAPIPADDGSVTWRGMQTVLDSRVLYRVYAGTDTRGVQVIDLAHDLQASIAGPSNVGIDTDFEYVSTITNAGPGDAPRVALTQVLPIENADFVAAVADQGSCAPPADTQLTCDLGTLAEGASVTVRVSMTSAERGLLNSRVSVSDFDGELSSGDNSAASTTAQITQLYDLMASVTAPATAQVGEHVTYTASATNAGPNEATDVTIVTEIPDGTTFFAASTDLRCTRADTVMTCTVATLAVGDSAAVDITYSADETGPLTATMSVSADTGTDNDPSNNDASVTTQASNPSSGGGGGGGGALDPFVLIGLLALGRRRGLLSRRPPR
jgi:uncharacterized repeat protein (TIGR01451 family)